MLVLGIETSCDETAASVVEDGRWVRSDVVASQIRVHAAFGGVVPEVASRQHVATIVPVLRQAAADAGIDLADLDGIAVTAGPGLVGALLVGVETAKSLGYALGKPVVGVNHLAGHLAAVYLHDRAPATGASTDAPMPPPPPLPPDPHLALLVSGGHTALIRVDGPGQTALLGATRDDAAGEASVMLQARPVPQGAELADFAASFQAAVVDVLCRKARRAVVLQGIPHLVVCGGVAANRGLRAGLAAAAAEDGFQIYIPPPKRCTDNAAMIAAAGTRLLARGDRAGLDLSVDPGLPL